MVVALALAVDVVWREERVPAGGVLGGGAGSGGWRGGGGDRAANCAETGPADEHRDGAGTYAGVQDGSAGLFAYVLRIPRAASG